jgi:hypothetical protein
MMATPAELYNAHPGDIVVPLSDMLDLLASRLSAAELDELSQTLISRRTTEVAAGDVITAELMNQILADIGNLQTRVAVLESGVPDSNRPQIVLIDPNNGVRIGEELQVFGFNLDPDQLTSVTIAGRTVTVFKPSSHSRMLAFDVPPILGIPEEGADVRLEVSNEYGSDDYMVNVQRSIADTLSATIFVNPDPEVVPQEPLEEGGSYEYGFIIRAFTTLDASYKLTPQIDNPDWGVEMKNGVDQINIPRSQPNASFHYVVVVVTPGSKPMAKLRLKVEAVIDSEQYGESPLIALELGEVTQPNTEIEIAMVPEQVVPSMLYETTSNTVFVPPVFPSGGGISNVTVTIVSTLKKADETYLISDPVVDNNTDDLWTVTRTSAASVDTAAPDQNHSITITIDLDDSAQTSTPDTVFRFTVQRQGSSQQPVEYVQPIKMYVQPIIMHVR